MSPQNLTNVYNQNPTLQSNYTLQQYLDLFGGGSTPLPATIQPVPTPNVPAKGIINQNINQYQGGGGGNNPYMPNSNVNTNYKPNYDFRQFSEYGMNPSTMDVKQMDMNQNYFNAPTPSATQQFLSKAINFVPGIGTVKRGAEFLGNALKGMMPINERAILENELRGSGVFTDDIGRIAIGPGGKYNTPEGIMAGYNANQMTDKTFDKRTGNIGKSLQEKTSLTEQQINDIVNEIATTGKYSGTLTDEELGVKNLFSNLVNVNMSKFNFKNQKKKSQDIRNFREAKRIQDELAAAAAAKSKAKALAAIKRQGRADYNPNIHGPNNYGRGSDGRQSFDSGQGFGVNSTTGGPVSNRTGRGRTDYRYGGRASYFNGGIVSLRRR